MSTPSIPDRLSTIQVKVSDDGKRLVPTHPLTSNSTEAQKYNRGIALGETGLLKGKSVIIKVPNLQTNDHAQVETFQELEYRVNQSSLSKFIGKASYSNKLTPEWDRSQQLGFCFVAKLLEIKTSEDDLERQAQEAANPPAKYIETSTLKTAGAISAIATGAFYFLGASTAIYLAAPLAACYYLNSFYRDVIQSPPLSQNYPDRLIPFVNVPEDDRANPKIGDEVIELETEENGWTEISYRDNADVYYDCGSIHDGVDPEESTDFQDTDNEEGTLQALSEVPDDDQATDSSASITFRAEGNRLKPNVETLDETIKNGIALQPRWTPGSLEIREVNGNTYHVNKNSFIKFMRYGSKSFTIGSEATPEMLYNYLQVKVAEHIPDETSTSTHTPSVVDSSDTESANDDDTASLVDSNISIDDVRIPASASEVLDNDDDAINTVSPTHNLTPRPTSSEEQDSPSITFEIVGNRLKPNVETSDGTINKGIALQSRWILGSLEIRDSNRNTYHVNKNSFRKFMSYRSDSFTIGSDDTPETLYNDLQAKVARYISSDNSSSDCVRIATTAPHDTDPAAPAPKDVAPPAKAPPSPVVDSSDTDTDADADTDTDNDRTDNTSYFGAFQRYHQSSTQTVKPIDLGAAANIFSTKKH